MSERLKPCPFCGGKAELTYCKVPMERPYGLPKYLGDLLEAFVECTKCHAKTEYIRENIHICADEEAIKLWNKRKERDGV